MHDPDNPLPDDYDLDIDDHSKQDVHTELLGLTYDFFRQASAQVLTELSRFLTTQHDWHPIAGREAYIDRVGSSSLSPCTDKRTHSQQPRKGRSATERPYSSPQPGPRTKPDKATVW